MPKVGELERPQTARARDERYVRITTDSFERSRDEFSPMLRRYGMLYNLYRGYRQGRMAPFRNNITIPLAFSMVQSYTAKLSNIEFADPRLVTFLAVGPEDQRLARKRDATVNLQFWDAETMDKGHQMLVASGIFGTIPYEWHWDVRQELQRYQADFGQGVALMETPTTTFDGPNWQPLDPRCLFICPGYNRIQRGMPWLVKRFFMDIEDVNRLAEEGVFNKRGTVDLGAPSRLTGKDEFLTSHNDPARLSIDAPTSEIDRPVEILLRWGRVPRSMAINGSTNLIIVVANRKHLLRAAPNPFGMIPVSEFQPMPDPFYWHGPSIVEVASKLQVAANALASQKMDALQLNIDPVVLYNRRNVQPKRRMEMRPNAWLAVDGELGPNIMPWSPDLRGMQMSYQETEQLSQWMEQGTGVIRDAIQGFGGPDRETARGFLGRQASAEVRLLLTARIFERQVTEPLAMQFVRLNREFLTFPHQFRMLGAAAILDPVTLQPTPAETDLMFANDMLPDYEARGLGATRGATQREDAAAMLQFMQAAQTNPIGIQVVNWMAFFRQLLTKLNVHNVDELLGTDSIIMQAIANAMGAAQGQQPQPQQPQQQAPLVTTQTLGGLQ